MTLSDESTSNTNHVRHQFDEAIANLRQKISNLGNETLILWGLNREALIDGNLKLASDVIARQNDAKIISLEIEQIVIELLADEQRVASDLRFVLSSMKLAYELRSMMKIAHEMARLILALYVPQNGVPDFNLIVDLSKLDLRLYYVVVGLIEAINKRLPKHSLQLLEDSALIESSIRSEIIVLVDFIQANPHKINPLLTILQMMKALESCSRICKDSARYCSDMINSNF